MKIVYNRELKKLNQKWMQVYLNSCGRLKQVGSFSASDLQNRCKTSLATCQYSSPQDIQDCYERGSTWEYAPAELTALSRIEERFRHDMEREIKAIVPNRRKLGDTLQRLHKTLVATEPLIRPYGKGLKSIKRVEATYRGKVRDAMIIAFVPEGKKYPWQLYRQYYPFIDSVAIPQTRLNGDVIRKWPADNAQDFILAREFFTNQTINDWYLTGRDTITIEPRFKFEPGKNVDQSIRHRLHYISEKLVVTLPPNLPHNSKDYLLKMNSAVNIVVPPTSNNLERGRIYRFVMFNRGSEPVVRVDRVGSLGVGGLSEEARTTELGRLEKANWRGVEPKRSVKVNDGYAIREFVLSVTQRLPDRVVKMLGGIKIVVDDRMGKHPGQYDHAQEIVYLNSRLAGDWGDTGLIIGTSSYGHFVIAHEFGHAIYRRLFDAGLRHRRFLRDVLVAGKALSTNIDSDSEKWADHFAFWLLDPSTTNLLRPEVYKELEKLRTGNF